MPWRAQIRYGTRIVPIAVHDDPDRPIEAEAGIRLLLAETILRDVTVDLTATGPTVEVASDDPSSIVAWIADTFEIVEVDEPMPWPDPRTDLPAGAYG